MFTDLERRRAEVDRHRENSARQAQAFAKFETVGVGAMEFEERIDFGLTFIDEPYVTYGSHLDVDALGEQLGLEPGALPPLPMTCGMVTAWDRDERDFYIGAWVATHVFFPTGEVVKDMIMQHYFTFQTIAIKDVPMDVRD